MADEAAYDSVIQGYHIYKWLLSAAATSVVAELDSAQEAYSQPHNFNIERCWSSLLQERVELLQIS